MHWETEIQASSNVAFVGRINVDGTLDTTFGNAGYVTQQFSGGVDAFAQAVALEPDGKMVVTGTDTATVYHQFVLRYTLGGTLDPNFRIRRNCN